MIFKEQLVDERENIRPALDHLFFEAKRNQTHVQDIFLVINQGYYDESLEKNILGLSKYVLGLPGYPGLEYLTAYEFIDSYRQSVATTKSDYNKFVERMGKKPDGPKLISKNEIVAIQLEQLIYLKFWESNFVIRQLYQLTRLANGEDYDWDFTLKKKSRSNILLNEIIGKLTGSLKCFATVLLQSYKPQIRNAIAHSLFFHIGNTLHFTNYLHNPDDDIKILTFGEWSTYIHKTLVLFDELIRHRLMLQKEFAENALQQSEHRLVYRLKTKVQNEMRTIKYFKEIDRWGEIK